MTGDKLLFSEMYQKQMEFQRMVAGNSAPPLPHDNPVMFQYHMTAMTEELGEVLKADKRWKTHRNTTHIPEEKLDEIADCIITMINVAMWSGFTQEEVYEGVMSKIERNVERLMNKDAQKHPTNTD